jgi:hypothetical protein
MQVDYMPWFIVYRDSDLKVVCWNVNVDRLICRKYMLYKPFYFFKYKVVQI